MISIIFHWNEIDFRKAILITGLEEAEFYEPDAEIDIKCFVVVTIRNSYLEQIFCDDCHTFGMSKPLNEENVKIITGKAIEYFRSINFSELARRYIYSKKMISI